MDVISIYFLILLEILVFVDSNTPNKNETDLLDMIKNVNIEDTLLSEESTEHGGNVIQFSGNSLINDTNKKYFTKNEVLDLLDKLKIGNFSIAEGSNTSQITNALENVNHVLRRNGGMDFGVVAELIKNLFSLLYEQAPSLADDDSKQKKTKKQMLLAPIKGVSLLERDEWVAQPPAHKLDYMKPPASDVIVHHTATAICASVNDCKKSVRHIQMFHMDSNGWDDIGYNFLVGSDGTVLEGRGWDHVGDHTKGHNADSIGIALLGTFVKEAPKKAQMNALRSLISEGVRIEKIAKDYKLYPHSHFAHSSSPGAKVVDVIKKWPHYVHDKEGTFSMSHKKTTRILKRDDWLARPPAKTLRKMSGQAKGVIIQHTSTEPCYNRAECLKAVRHLQMYHIDSEGLDDIGFNFLVGGDGIVYEGRGWDYVGDHTKGQDKTNIGVALLGTFQVQDPTERQMNALRNLLDEGVKLKKLSKRYKLTPENFIHETDSPGKKVLKTISSWPHFVKIKKDKSLLREGQSQSLESGEVTIVPRSEWLGSTARPNLPKLKLPVRYVFVHHTGTRNCSELEECMGRMRHLRNLHISRGSEDVIYNFVIGGDGIAYEGRGWDYAGNHTKGHNDESIGIALMGYFDSETKAYPNKAQVKACQLLLKEGVALNILIDTFNVRFRVR